MTTDLQQTKRIQAANTQPAKTINTDADLVTPPRGGPTKRARSKRTATNRKPPAADQGPQPPPAADQTSQPPSAAGRGSQPQPEPSRLLLLTQHGRTAPANSMAVSLANHIHLQPKSPPATTDGALICQEDASPTQQRRRIKTFQRFWSRRADTIDQTGWDYRLQRFWNQYFSDEEVEEAVEGLSEAHQENDNSNGVDLADVALPRDKADDLEGGEVQSTESTYRPIDAEYQRQCDDGYVREFSAIRFVDDGSARVNYDVWDRRPATSPETENKAPLNETVNKPRRGASKRKGVSHNPSVPADGETSEAEQLAAQVKEELRSGDLAPHAYDTAEDEILIGGMRRWPTRMRPRPPKMSHGLVLGGYSSKNETEERRGGEPLELVPDDVATLPELRAVYHNNVFRYVHPNPPDGVSEAGDTVAAVSPDGTAEMIWKKVEGKGCLAEIGAVDCQQGSVFKDANSIDRWPAGGIYLRSVFGMWLQTHKSNERYRLCDWMSLRQKTHVMIVAIDRLFPRETRAQLDVISRLMSQLPNQLEFIVASREEPWQVREYLCAHAFRFPIGHANTIAMRLLTARRDMADLSEFDKWTTGVSLWNCMGNRLYVHEGYMADLRLAMIPIMQEVYWRTVPCECLIGVPCTAMYWGPHHHQKVDRITAASAAEVHPVSLNVRQIMQERKISAHTPLSLYYRQWMGECSFFAWTRQFTEKAKHPPHAYLIAHINGLYGETVTLKHLIDQYILAQPLLAAARVYLILSFEPEGRDHFHIEDDHDDLCNFHQPVIVDGQKRLLASLGLNLRRPSAENSAGRCQIALIDKNLNLYYRDLGASNPWSLGQALHVWQTHYLAIATNVSYPKLDSYTLFAQWMWKYVYNPSTVSAKDVVPIYRPEFKHLPIIVLVNSSDFKGPIRQHVLWCRNHIASELHSHTPFLQVLDLIDSRVFTSVCWQGMFPQCRMENTFATPTEIASQIWARDYWNHRSARRLSACPDFACELYADNLGPFRGYGVIRLSEMPKVKDMDVKMIGAAAWEACQTETWPGICVPIEHLEQLGGRWRPHPSPPPSEDHQKLAKLFPAGFDTSCLPPIQSPPPVDPSLRLSCSQGKKYRILMFDPAAYIPNTAEEREIEEEEGRIRWARYRAEERRKRREARQNSVWYDENDDESQTSEPPLLDDVLVGTQPPPATLATVKEATVGAKQLAAEVTDGTVTSVKPFFQSSVHSGLQYSIELGPLRRHVEETTAALVTPDEKKIAKAETQKQSKKATSKKRKGADLISDIDESLLADADEDADEDNSSSVGPISGESAAVRPKKQFKKADGGELISRQKKGKRKAKLPETVLSRHDSPRSKASDLPAAAESAAAVSAPAAGSVVDDCKIEEEKHAELALRTLGLPASLYKTGKYVTASTSEIDEDSEFKSEMDQKRGELLVKANLRALRALNVICLPAKGADVWDRMLAADQFSEARECVGEAGGIIVKLAGELLNRPHTLFGVKPREVSKSNSTLKLEILHNLSAESLMAYRLEQKCAVVYLYGSDDISFLLSIHPPPDTDSGLDEEVIVTPDEIFRHIHIDIKPVKVLRGPVEDFITVTVDRQGIPRKDQRHFVAHGLGYINFRDMKPYQPLKRNARKTPPSASQDANPPEPAGKRRKVITATLTSNNRNPTRKHSNQTDSSFSPPHDGESTHSAADKPQSPKTDRLKRGTSSRRRKVTQQRDDAPQSPAEPSSTDNGPTDLHHNKTSSLAITHTDRKGTNKPQRINKRLQAIQPNAPTNGTAADPLEQHQQPQSTEAASATNTKESAEVEDHKQKKTAADDKGSAFVSQQRLRVQPSFASDIDDDSQAEVIIRAESKGSPHTNKPVVMNAKKVTAATRHRSNKAPRTETPTDSPPRKPSLQTKSKKTSPPPSDAVVPQRSKRQQINKTTTSPEIDEEVSSQQRSQRTNPEQLRSKGSQPQQSVSKVSPGATTAVVTRKAMSKVPPATKTAPGETEPDQPEEAEAPTTDKGAVLPPPMKKTNATRTRGTSHRVESEPTSASGPSLDGGDFQQTKSSAAQKPPEETTLQDDGLLPSKGKQVGTRRKEVTTTIESEQSSRKASEAGGKRRGAATGRGGKNSKGEEAAVASGDCSFQTDQSASAVSDPSESDVGVTKVARLRGAERILEAAEAVKATIRQAEEDENVPMVNRTRTSCIVMEATKRAFNVEAMDRLLDSGCTMDMVHGLLNRRRVAQSEGADIEKHPDVLAVDALFTSDMSESMFQFVVERLKAFDPERDSPTTHLVEQIETCNLNPTAANKRSRGGSKQSQVVHRDCQRSRVTKDQRVITVQTLQKRQTVAKKVATLSRTTTDTHAAFSVSADDLIEPELLPQSAPRKLQEHSTAHQLSPHADSHLRCSVSAPPKRKLRINPHQHTPIPPATPVTLMSPKSDLPAPSLPRSDCSADGHTQLLLRPVKLRASKSRCNAMSAALMAESDSMDSDGTIERAVTEKPPKQEETTVSVSHEDLDQVIRNLERGQVGSPHLVLPTAATILNGPTPSTSPDTRRKEDCDPTGSHQRVVDCLIDRAVGNQRRVKRGRSASRDRQQPTDLGEPLVKKTRQRRTSNANNNKGLNATAAAGEDMTMIDTQQLLPQIYDVDPIFVKPSSSDDIEEEAKSMIQKVNARRNNGELVTQQAFAQVDIEVVERLSGSRTESIASNSASGQLVVVNKEPKTDVPPPPAAKRRGRKSSRSASASIDGRSSSRPQRARKPSLVVVESTMEALEAAEKRAAKKAEQEARRMEAESRKAEAEAKRAVAETKKAEIEAKKAARRAEAEERRKAKAEAKAAAKATVKRTTRKNNVTPPQSGGGGKLSPIVDRSVLESTAGDDTMEELLISPPPTLEATSSIEHTTDLATTDAPSETAASIPTTPTDASLLRGADPTTICKLSGRGRGRGGGGGRSSSSSIKVPPI